MRPTRIATARPIAVRPPANLGFMRTVDVGIRSPSAPDGRCKVRVAAGAVERPLFSSNLSTFMSNCILVVTTLERSDSGRCRTTILPQARACPVRIPPAWAFFIAVLCRPAPGCLPPWLTQMSFFKYNPTVVKGAFLPVVECIPLTLNLV
jgi:hypothetical protein